MPEITFDKAASRLEEIINLLENGKCSLEESVELVLKIVNGKRTEN